MNNRFGTMCPYKTTLCQEREGCMNCQIFRDWQNKLLEPALPEVKRRKRRQNNVAT